MRMQYFPESLFQGGHGTVGGIQQMCKFDEFLNFARRSFFVFLCVLFRFWVVVKGSADMNPWIWRWWHLGTYANAILSWKLVPRRSWGSRWHLPDVQIRWVSKLCAEKFFFDCPTTQKEIFPSHRGLDIGGHFGRVDYAREGKRWTGRQAAGDCTIFYHWPPCIDRGHEQYGKRSPSSHVQNIHSRHDGIKDRVVFLSQSMQLLIRDRIIHQYQVSNLISPVIVIHNTTWCTEFCLLFVIHFLSGADNVIVSK